MSHRFLFYAPALERDHARVELAGEEHHHLARVLRLRVADEIHVTNGRGLLAAARLERLTRARSEASITRVVAEECPPRRFVLALALIGRDRFVQAFEQCVELGVTECVPLITAACRRGRAEGAFHQRLERVAVAAMKQAFRCHRPVVRPVSHVHALCASVGDFERAVVGDPEGEAAAECTGDTLVVVGPEGGLTPDELAALEAAGVVRAAVSRHRLRAETAAVALVAALARAD